SAEDQFDCRDEIMDQLRSLFIKKTTQEWLNILELDDIWCADVKDYQGFLNHKAYQVLLMEQELNLSNGQQLTTTRCSIRIDKERFSNSTAAPQLGEDTKAINKEFDLAMQYEDLV